MVGNHRSQPSFVYGLRIFNYIKINWNKGTVEMVQSELISRFIPSIHSADPSTSAQDVLCRQRFTIRRSGNNQVWRNKTGIELSSDGDSISCTPLELNRIDCSIFFQWPCNNIIQLQWPFFDLLVNFTVTHDNNKWPNDRHNIFVCSNLQTAVFLNDANILLRQSISFLCR